MFAKAARGSLSRRSAGFTLVEILTVVVILGIASAVIIPQMGSRDDMRVEAAARTLISDLIYAQNMAIANGAHVYVRFDVAGNKYSVLTNPSSIKAKFGDPAQHPITQTDYVQQFGASARGWEAVTIQAAPMNGIDASYQGEFTVGFDEIGSPYVFCYDVNQKNELNDGSITLQAGAFTKVITISPATGEISVK
jgi:prepilin-type N-terminal cleavage/methylation domain-containing protein